MEQDGGARSDPRTEVVVDVRPWGQFELLACNENATVKIITVEPSRRLSLQRHAHRDELWMVLDGPLVVETDGAQRTATAGDKVWVPRGTAHRITNTASAPGRILEIAYGAFDEGDIERLADDYDRC